MPIVHLNTKWKTNGRANGTTATTNAKQNNEIKRLLFIVFPIHCSYTNLHGKLELRWSEY